MLITFEGGEGCGKTTHIDLLAQHLKTLGRDVVVTKEPGGTEVGAKLRNILLEGEPEVFSEIFLFAADRVEHVEKIIRPALNAGKIVLCDRYLDSTLAYQLGGRGLPEDLVRYVNWISCRGVLPALTFLLDIPVADGIKRAKERGKLNRFDSEIIAFHERVRDKYIEIADNDKGRIVIVESLRSVDVVQKQIREIAEKRLR